MNFSIYKDHATLNGYKIYHLTNNKNLIKNYQEKIISENNLHNLPLLPSPSSHHVQHAIDFLSDKPESTKVSVMCKYHNNNIFYQIFLERKFKNYFMTIHMMNNKSNL